MTGRLISVESEPRAASHAQRISNGDRRARRVSSGIRTAQLTCRQDAPESHEPRGPAGARAIDLARASILLPCLGSRGAARRRDRRRTDDSTAHAVESLRSCVANHSLPRTAMAMPDSLRNAPAASQPRLASRTRSAIAVSAPKAVVRNALRVALGIAVALSAAASLGVSAGCESDGRPVSSKSGSTKSSVTKSRPNWDSSPGAVR